MTSNESIIVTGAGGFVGRALLARIGAPCRTLHLAPDDWAERIDSTEFSGATVFHLAARVHASDDDEARFQRDNRDKTVALAQAAGRGRARRLVFVSSSKAMGEETLERAFRVEDTPLPVDAYGRSKLAAERGLEAVARSTGLQHVVVRAPIVLGAGATGNLAALVRACDSLWPLPLGAIRNRRSFVDVDDLAGLLVACAEAPVASGRTYLAAYRSPFSTPQLVAAIRTALGRPVRLFDVPPAWLERAGAMARKGELVRRLTRSLELDPSRAENDLGWRAQTGLELAVKRMIGPLRERAA